MDKNILLMYISEHSGHHQSSIALERALLNKDPSCRILNINAFKYTNPVMEKVTHKAYMGIIKKKPEIWERLYDNPSVAEKTRRLREIVQNAGVRKIQRLIKKFNPDAIACTQALPCSLAAGYKKMYAATLPLLAILTDYAPHAYWIHEAVDFYIVPSDDVGGALVKKGVPQEKIKAFGTPIDPAFEKPLDRPSIRKKTALSPDVPVILVMGGTHGLGPGEKLVKTLNKSAIDFQIIVVAGVNKKLFRTVKDMVRDSAKKIVPLGFVNNVHELMEISDVIITKPGGVTTAESLAKGVPMIILNPLPGQEGLNTKTLTKKGLALKAESEKDALSLVEELLGDTAKLRKMSDAMRACAKPHSAKDTAELLLKLAG